MLGNKRIMGNNILFYMNKMGIERRDFAKAIGVPYSSLTDWINGNTYPRIDKIERMASFFGIEKSDLVEDKAATRTIKGARIPPLYVMERGGWSSPQTMRRYLHVLDKQREEFSATANAAFTEALLS